MGGYIVAIAGHAAAARAYIASPEYQAARGAREGAAEVEMRLLVD